MNFINYYGCSLPEMPEGAIGVGAVVLLKVIENDGSMRYHEFASGMLSAQEQLGMLMTAGDTVRTNLMKGIKPA